MPVGPLRCRQLISKCSWASAEMTHGFGLIWQRFHGSGQHLMVDSGSNLYLVNGRWQKRDVSFSARKDARAASRPEHLGEDARRRDEVQYQEFMRWSALLALELGSRRRLRLFVSTCASAAVVVPTCASAAVAHGSLTQCSGRMNLFFPTPPRHIAKLQEFFS